MITPLANHREKGTPSRLIKLPLKSNMPKSNIQRTRSIPYYNRG